MCPAPRRYTAKKTESTRVLARLLRDLIYILLHLLYPFLAPPL